MILNLEARQKHWDLPSNRAPRETHDLVDSMPYPFAPVEQLFLAEDVLEIGPGRGRQYERLKQTVKSYAICDISPAALQEPVFVDVKQKFLLQDYSQDFGVRFGIIHFWYVLHHVRAEELSAFFDFVKRHLRTDGLAIFNSPIATNNPEWYTDDGLGTTWMDIDLVLANCKLRVLESKSINSLSTGTLFVVEK